MDSTKRRWIRRNATTIGTMASTEPAMISPYWMTCWPRNNASPEDSVYIELLVDTISGHSRSFRDPFGVRLLPRTGRAQGGAVKR